MELENIDSLNLYIDKEFIHDETINTKRVPLDRDLDIGETAYFRDECKNKIVKHGDNEYIFYRFDGIQTHIEDYDSDYSIEDIAEKINSSFNYDLEYASERVDLINELIKENEWVYDLLSSNRVIQKEQKKKNSLLAENQTLDRQFQRIVDYILHPKFNDEDMKNYFEEMRERYESIKNKKGKSNSELVEMISLKDEIDLINHGVITKSREQRNKQRENHVDDFTILESTETFSKEFDHNRSKDKSTGKEIAIDKDYWLRMGFSKESAKSRQEIIDNYEEALEILVTQLGHGKPYEEKEKIRKNTVDNLEEIVYTNERGKTVVITSKNRFGRLNRMYNELKSDYNDTKEILTVPVSFSQIEPHFTKYNYNFDTWYIDEEENETEVTKNTILFSNLNTYKGLIENYYNLKDKYKDNFQDDMWAILFDFEHLLEKTELSEKERFVVGKIMNDYTRNEIVDEFFGKFGDTISMYSVSNMINKTIPSKMLEAYLDMIDEWLYTYKLKGNFKTCSKCNEVKLINNNRHFGKDSRNRDGFMSTCKQCDSYRKTPK